MHEEVELSVQVSRTYRAARAQRDKALGGLIVAGVAAVVATVRHASKAYRRHRLAAETYDALRTLDDRSLHDLGFDRSELASIAAETTNTAEGTRLRVAMFGQV